MTFDSNSEADFYARNKHILTPYNDAFFEYSSGKFKVDFIAPYNTHIEYKDYTLNLSPDKETAKKRYQKLVSNTFHPAKDHYAKLVRDWNHSLYKVEQVQDTLAAQGVPFLLVFSNRCKMTDKDKNDQKKALKSGKLTDARIKKMNKLGINWCYESELEIRLSPTLH